MAEAKQLAAHGSCQKKTKSGGQVRKSDPRKLRGGVHPKLKGNPNVDKLQIQGGRVLRGSGGAWRAAQAAGGRVTTGGGPR